MVLNVVFRDGDNFCKAFAGATRDMTYSRVLLQKLCKNCPHPEKPFSNSKTVSQIKFPYRIEKLVKSQQECPGRKTLCRSLVTCKGFFCPVVLLLLLCENGNFFTSKMSPWEEKLAWLAVGLRQARFFLPRTNFTVILSYLKPTAHSKIVFLYESTCYVLPFSCTHLAFSKRQG